MLLLLPCFLKVSACFGFTVGSLDFCIVMVVFRHKQGCINNSISHIHKVRGINVVQIRSLSPQRDGSMDRRMDRWTNWQCDSLYLSVGLSTELSVCLSLGMSLPFSVSVCLSKCLSACQNVCLLVKISVCLSKCLSACLSICLSASLSVLAFVFACYLLLRGSSIRIKRIPSDIHWDPLKIQDGRHKFTMLIQEKIEY